MISVIVVSPLIRSYKAGPPKDGIPSIDQPKFITANQATFLKPNDRILGVSIANTHRAYPIKIPNWHEVVNDSIQDKPVIISYCPLCGTGMVYQATIKGKALKFGVSGLLYNSDVLLYDRQTQTLWSQILAKAISGKWVNTRLTTIPSNHTTWKSWQEQHPDTLVLSTETGFQRNYNDSPYDDYDKSRNIYFPIGKNSKRFHPKERVLGITIAGKYKAYPFVELAKNKQSKIIDSFAGKNLIIEFNAENRDGTIRDDTGKVLTTINSFWFAWYAFHPESDIYSTR